MKLFSNWGIIIITAILRYFEYLFDIHFPCKLKNNSGLQWTQTQLYLTKVSILEENKVYCQSILCFLDVALGSYHLYGLAVTRESLFCAKWVLLLTYILSNIKHLCQYYQMRTVLNKCIRRPLWCILWNSVFWASTTRSKNLKF